MSSPLQTPPNRSRQIWRGILFSNLFATLVLLLIVAAGNTRSDAIKQFTVITTLLLPFLMGLICAWFWQGADLRFRARLGWVSLNTVIALALSSVVAKEGVICLLIISPLLISCMLVGTVIGHFFFQDRNTGLNASLAGFVVLFFVADILSPHQFETQVADSVVIKASPAVVWRYVAAYEPITRQPDFWLFRIGMPHPVNSTVDSYRKGAGRKCNFSNGYAFDEVMTVYEPGRELEFAITYQPRDPELMGHIDIQKGQFLLTDNHDGTTTLTGTSWYRLYVFPAWYYNLWAERITREVHLEVMQQIRRLSEQAAG